MKPYIYITRKINSDLLQSLEAVANVKMWDKEEEPVPRHILLEEAKSADGLLTMLSEKVDQELMDEAQKLKVVANLAVGYDNIDVDYATKKGIAVCNTPDVLTDTTADLTFALLMATARRIGEARDYILQGKWIQWSPMLLAGQDIHHKTIGIVGMGRIGQAVAKRATGFEMNILYHNRTRNEEAEQTVGAQYKSFDEILELSDFVVCLTPLTPDTKGLFNEDAFRRMKKNAVFINASRGAVVDETALYNALIGGEIQAAGLDVFTKEPIDVDHPLLKLDNVLALPHIGSASYETRTKMMALAIDNIHKVITGQKPKALVNRDA